MKPIKKLEGKTVGIVGLGSSWLEYNLAKSHGLHFDEVWIVPCGLRKDKNNHATPD